jgi:hypothetical protein
MRVVDLELVAGYPGARGYMAVARDAPTAN